MSTTSTSAIELLSRCGAKVRYQPDFFAPDEADRQLAALLAEVQFSRPEESRGAACSASVAPRGTGAGAGGGT